MTESESPSTARWEVRKSALASPHGVVAAQNWLAAEAGAAILARGGNAVDAAVATALALTVAEPWLSGIAGCGFMLVFTARDRKVHGIDYGCVAPRALDPAVYRVLGEEDDDWFNWPKVEGDRNLKGVHSVCVPGSVAGFELALRSFGTLSWAEAMAPAIRLAEAGLLIDWYSSLNIAVDADGLDEFPATRAVFLPNGRPPAAPLKGERRLPLGRMAQTLQRLAAAGPRDFYEGDLAADIVADLAAGGSAISGHDLADYRARLVEPMALDYRGARLHAVPGLSGGPTFLDAMRALSQSLAQSSALDAAAVVAQARAIRDAYDRRLTEFGHAGTTNEPGCTTHVSVIDAAGNAVALTNSLLSRFGSKVVLPRTGILANNGIMWFDPRPGRANSIAPGARPLANMNPVLVTRDGAPLLAIGAAGGRQIVPAVAQLVSYLLDFGLPIEAAFHVPRLDASSPTVVCNSRMPSSHVAALTRNFPVVRADDTVYPVRFANPSAVYRDGGTDMKYGMTHITAPWAGAAAGIRQASPELAAANDPRSNARNRKTSSTAYAPGG